MASESKEEHSSMDNTLEEGEKAEQVENNDIKNSAKEEPESHIEKGSEKDQSEKDDDSEDDEMVGLLDRPVEVTGCRARKQVERLEYNASSTKEKQEILEGIGQKLGDCPRIEHQIQKTTSTDLKLLHRVLFGRVGSANEIKKNIRRFSGFTFDKSSPEFDRKKSMVEKLTMSVLKNMCEIVDIERGGTKEEIVMRLMDFLLDPKDSGKKLIAKKKSSKDKKKSDSKKNKTKKEKSKKVVSTEEISSSNASEDSNSGKEEPVEEIKVSKPAKLPKEKAKKHNKEKGDKKPATKGSKRKQEDLSSGSGEESNPKKKNREPTDDEIQNLVKTILDNADLHEITMKKVIKQVGEHFPTLDLAQKKAFIKETIKSVIS